MLLALFTLYVGSERCINRVEGLVLLALYIISTIYAIRTGRNDKADVETDTTDGKGESVNMGWGKVMLFIVIGLVGLIFGGNLCLNSATAIARAWGVSEAIIAVTVVAAGTSLPELASSVAAVVSNRPSLALGNIIGSNIANILLILGVCGSIKPLTMGGITPLDIWMVVAVAVVLLISALVIGVRRITRAEGVLYLAIYVGYVVMLLR